MWTINITIKKSTLNSEKIFFEIVDASGNTSKSREEYKIEVLKEPSIVNLVLNFTKYP